MIESKPCHYGGYLMRSHAERTLAQILDVLRINWLYEPALWETSAGAYLPDFEIPAADCFIEVKGPHPTQDEIAKAEGLMAASGKQVIFVFGLSGFGVFNQRLLPMGGMILAKKLGRWTAIPLSLVCDLVYELIGESEGLRFAMSARSIGGDAVNVPESRSDLERMIVGFKENANGQKEMDHHAASACERAAFKAVAWLGDGLSLKPLQREI